MKSLFPLAIIAAASLIAAQPSVQRSQIEQKNVFDLPQGTISSPTPKGWGFFTEASFLYWLPKQDGLEYAFIMDSGTTDGEFNPANFIPMSHGRYKRPDFEWQPGVQLQAGCHLPLDQWGIVSRWTRFVATAHSSASVSSTETETLSPLWLAADYNFGYSSSLAASSRWNLHYNILDLALQKAYFSGSSLVLSPQVGLRGAWINQSFHVDYSGGNYLVFPSSFRGKNNFGSCGLFSGIDMQWRFVNSFRLLGQLLGAVNCGRYHVTQRSSGKRLDSGGDLIGFLSYNNPSQIFHRLRFCYEAAIGVQWEHIFAKSDTRLSFSGLYNLSQWFHMNQLRMFTFKGPQYTSYFVPQNGNLNFQGISLAGRFDF